MLKTNRKDQMKAVADVNQLVVADIKLKFNKLMQIASSTSQTASLRLYYNVKNGEHQINSGKKDKTS